jgi:hypothetical protein
MIQKFRPIFMSTSAERCETTTALLEHGPFNTSMSSAAFQLWIFTEIDEIESDEEPAEESPRPRVKSELLSSKRRKNVAVKKEPGAIIKRELDATIKREPGMDVKKKPGSELFEETERPQFYMPTRERSATARLDLEAEPELNPTDASAPNLPDTFLEPLLLTSSDESHQAGAAEAAEVAEVAEVVEVAEVAEVAVVRHKRTHSRMSPQSQEQSNRARESTGRGRLRDRPKASSRKVTVPVGSRCDSTGPAGDTSTTEASHGYQTRASGRILDV